MRTSWKTGMMTAATASLVLMGATTAQAATSASYTQNTASGYCKGTVRLVGTDQNNAQGSMVNAGSGFTCLYWLERGHLVNGSVNDYAPIGSFGSNPNSLESEGGYTMYGSTGWYWDGAGLRVRTCFRLTDGSWYGVVHCTDGV